MKVEIFVRGGASEVGLGKMVRWTGEVGCEFESSSGHDVPAETLEPINLEPQIVLLFIVRNHTVIVKVLLVRDALFFAITAARRKRSMTFSGPV
jgi:hypothetical protein